MLEISWRCSSSNFVYNFNKTLWFPLMWMVFLLIAYIYLQVKGDNIKYDILIAV